MLTPLMALLLAGGISSAAGLVGQGVSAGVNTGLQKDSQAFNSLEAQKNRDFQKEMSSSAYQRQVADMKKAGLNPALMSNLTGSSTMVNGSSAHSPQNSIGGFSAHIPSGLIMKQFSNDSTMEKLGDALRTGDLTDLTKYEKSLFFKLLSK